MLIKMDCINFSETKAERKYYEGKKQKALDMIDNLIGSDDYFHKTSMTPTLWWVRHLKSLRKVVNDI